MIENTPRGIQATLFDYFQDTEYFSIQDANELVLEQQNRDVNKESIRARIYEGIDKGHHIVVAAYVKGDRERYVAVVKCSNWYKNMARHKNSLSEKISAAQQVAQGAQQQKTESGRTNEKVGPVLQECGDR